MTVRSNDLTVFANWLKDQYYGPEPEMLETFNTSNYFMDEDLFNRKISTTEDGGNNFVYFLETAWPAGFRSVGESVALPDARAGAYQKIYGSMYNHYMTCRFTGPGQQRTRSDTYSFADVKKHGLETIPKAFSQIMGEQAWRYNGDGVIAQVNDDPTTGTNLNVYESGEYTSDTVGTFGTRHFHPQMEISFWNGRPTRSSGTQRDADNTVTAIVDADDVTLGSAAASAIAQYDFVTWRVPYSAGTPLYPQEITGLMAHISKDNITVHGVNKSTNSFFQPAFVTGSHGDGTAFALSHLDTDVTTLVHTLGPSRSRRLVIITTPLLANKIAREMKDLVRFESDDFDMKWGYRTISYVQWGCRATIVADDTTHAGCLWYLNPNAFEWHQTQDPHIAKDDGQTIRWVSGYDCWEFFMRWISELVCVNPKSCGLHRGFSQT